MKNINEMIILIVIIFTASVIAQDRIDVIYLKNGDIIKGIIVENVPNEYVKIELKGGSIFTFKYSEIEKFIKENVIQFRKSEEINQKPNIIIQQQQQQQQQQSPVVEKNTNLKKELTYNQKMLLYEDQKKSPTTAGVLSFLISSTGHAYAGNWGRGLLFLGGRILLYSIALNATTEDAAAGGLLGVIALSIWEIVDAVNEVGRYNERLYNRIISGVPDFGVNIIPINKGAKMMLTINL